tara:strand:- start:1922 stop:2164 length:243 start_codon:yes stop_codon:yes gene_type:complete
MTSTIWTAILKRGVDFSASYEYASRDADQAKNEIQNRHPGCSVVALVLGRHTTAHTFSERKISEKDYYDQQHNQPTGGSD